MTRSSSSTLVAISVFMIGPYADLLADSVIEKSELADPWSVLAEADEYTISRINPWLQSVHVPEVRFYVRSRIVRIDVDMLFRKLEQSFDNPSEKGTCADERQLSNTDLIIRLFPEVEYRFAVCRYRIGRYGHTHARGIVAGSVSDRSRLYFELSPSMDLIASIKGNLGIFRIEKTPEAGFYVITEIDAKKLGQSIRID